MDLQKITGALIFSFIASFFIRITGTSFPFIFQNVYVVKLAIITNTFFMFVQLLFFVYFLKVYAENREQSLKFVSFLTIIGSFSVLFIYVKNFCLVFDIDVIPLFLMHNYLDAFIPVASSIFHLLFFMTFKKVQTHEELKNLNRAILSAIIGIVFFIFLHLIVLITYLKYNIFNWLEHMPRVIAVCTLPLIAIAAVLVLYFYIKFYKFISYSNKKLKLQITVRKIN